MSNSVTDLIIQLQNEAVAYDQRSRQANGSDRKVFRKLSTLTKDHAASVQEGIMLAFTRPLMEIITPEFAKTLVANARQTNRGVGQAFKDSANVYIENAAKMEGERFGGVVFTKAVLAHLNLVNWAYLGQYIEIIAGDVDVDSPLPKTCGRNDCAVLEKRVPEGWTVGCDTCKRTTEVMATKPQAIAKWNELEFDEVKEKIDRAPEYDSAKASRTLSSGGYALTPADFEALSDEDKGKALNYVSSGKRIPEPLCLINWRRKPSHLQIILAIAGASVPVDIIMSATEEERDAAFKWASAWDQHYNYKVKTHIPPVPNWVIPYISE